MNVQPQSDLFDKTQHPLIGQKVRPPTRCRCGSNVAVVRPGAGPHAFELRCSARIVSGYPNRQQAGSPPLPFFGAPEVITLRTRSTLSETSSDTTSDDSRALAEAAAKTRKQRKPEDWQTIYDAALAKKRDEK